MTYVPNAWVDYGVPCIEAATLNTMEDGIDRAQGDVMVLRGLLAALPATDPLLVGRLYFATDTSELFRDNGAGWNQVFFDHGDLIGLGDNDHPQYIQDAEFAALGDILVGTGAATFANLGVGAAGEVLTVAGGTATWAAGAAGVWALIAETILGAPAAAITFAAIPGTYRALFTVASVRSTIAAEIDIYAWRANGDSGAAKYAWFYWYRSTTTNSLNGDQADSEATHGTIEGGNASANYFSDVLSEWLYYAETDRVKHGALVNSGSLRNLSAVGEVACSWGNGAWLDTAAITSLTFFAMGGNLDTGSRIALYGIT